MQINGKMLKEAFISAALTLQDMKSKIDELNVYPVPDGDTGTNMALTLATVTAEIEALPGDADLTAIAKAITHGSLMGARGNSGVITSQLLRGLRDNSDSPADRAAAFSSKNLSSAWYSRFMSS